MRFSLLYFMLQSPLIYRYLLRDAFRKHFDLYPRRDIDFSSVKPLPNYIVTIFVNISSLVIRSRGSLEILNGYEIFEFWSNAFVYFKYRGPDCVSRHKTGLVKVGRTGDAREEQRE